MEVSPHSQLPEFVKGKRIAANGHHWTIIVCPRCKASFHVSYGAWSERGWADLKVDTRPCPYCFKAAWLPGKKPVPKPSSGRRVVKRRKGRK